MSSMKYLSGAGSKRTGGASAFDEPDTGDENATGSSEATSSFLSGFRRTRNNEERTKAQISIAASASVAANARKFVANFMARKGGKDLPTPGSDDEEDAVAHPKRFNPSNATGAKGFVGAVAGHLHENEARKAKLRAHRAHQMAVKGVYNKQQATTPTTAPPGAPRFFHTLPSTLPSSYFTDISMKAEEAQLPGPNNNSSSPSRAFASPEEQGASSGPQRDFASYWECDEVSRDMLYALRTLSAKGLYGKAGFVANERVQSIKDVPLRELAQGDFLWRTWRAAVDSFITTHATTALNARYMLGSGKGRWVVIGNSSVLDVLEGVLVHVWRSSVAAKEFISGWRRVWGAVFESRLEGVTCPFSAGYRIQGSFVTVTALCPIEPTFTRWAVKLSPQEIWGSHGACSPGQRVDLSDLVSDGTEPVEARSTALRHVMRRFCHATCIDVPPPLFLGLDGRYYILDVRYVLQPSFGDAVIRARPRLDLLLQMRDLRGLVDEATGVVMPLPATVDRYAEEQCGVRGLMTVSVLSTPLKFVKVVAARRCAIDALKALAELDLDAPLSTESILDKNLVSQLCHRAGLNLCFLPLLLEQVTSAAIPEELLPDADRQRLAVMFADAIRVEMLARTLKELAAIDLNHGVTASTPMNDTQRRIHVPNRIASLTVAKDPYFFQDQVMPKLRAKFFGASDLVVEPGSSSAGRLLRNLIFHLGCELCGEQKRFTHYCPIAQTYAMVMRPPRTAEMYLAKQYAELDVEVPLMWRRWALTPVKSPVRHSAFVHGAFLTLLCRASEKYAFVRESADDCAPDFDDDLYLQAEVYAVSAEAALISARDPGPLRVYVAQLRKVHRNGEDDSPVFAVKFINAAVLASRCNLAIMSANALIRLEKATPSVHSATCAFAVSIAEAMLVSETSEEVLGEYLNMSREHCRQVRASGVKFGIRVMMHSTGVLFAAKEQSAAYASAASVEFARESLRMQMEGFGPRNRCTCVTTYHVMIIALRERFAATKLPVAERHHKLCLRVLELLFKAEVKAVPAMTRSERSIDLMQRVINVLRDAGDKSTAALIRQQRESLIRGELVEPAAEEDPATASNRIGGASGDDDDLAASPSGVLASSVRHGSFANNSSMASRGTLNVEEVEALDDEQLSASLHSPSNDERSLHSPNGADASDSTVTPIRSFRFAGAGRAARNASNRFGRLRSNDDDDDDELARGSSVRLSQVNVTLKTDEIEDLE